ncbi:UNVERIFIED_ORG: hypothetical protein ABID57_000676 [Arthrobacter sp. UYEF1]
MSGTKVGGLKAAATNKKLYGEDFYHRLGAAGGAVSKGGGFAADHDFAVAMALKSVEMRREKKAKQSE